MKVIEKVRSEKAIMESDFRSAIHIFIDDKQVFSVGDGEPEDSNLSRDFSDCYSIVSLMEKMYQAGKSGEDVEFIYEDSDDI